MPFDKFSFKKINCIYLSSGEQRIYIFPHFCPVLFYIFHYTNKSIFFILSRVIFIPVFDFCHNKDPYTNSLSSPPSLVIISPSPGKIYFREYDCTPDIVDQGRFIVIFQLTLVRGQDYYIQITRGPLTASGSNTFNHDNELPDGLKREGNKPKSVS
jgi:hypothetical protein